MPLHLCTSCGSVAGEVKLQDLIDIGLEPPIDLVIAAMLVPCTPKQLSAHLSKRKDMFPPTYRKYRMGKTKCRTRILSPREIWLVRSQRLRGPGKSQWLR